MLQRDYIMKLITQFFEGLSELLSSSKKDKGQDIIEMYNAYVGPYDKFHTEDEASIMQSFDKYGEKERLYRMEMLAELYLAESSMKMGEACESLLHRSYALFVYINEHSNTFSADRLHKIDTIAKALSISRN